MFFLFCDKTACYVLISLKFNLIFHTIFGLGIFSAADLEVRDAKIIFIDYALTNIMTGLKIYVFLL